MKKIIILGAGEMQIPIILKAKELSLYTIVVDFDADAPGFKHADSSKIISTIDYESIKKLAHAEAIAGIVTTSDLPVTVVAKVAKELSIPAMSIEVSNICTNKFLQREFFKNNSIKTPKYLLIENENELLTIDFYPVVIKPVDSSASRGVKKVNSLQELLTQYLQTKKFSKSGKVIIEEYIPGKEFSVETFTQNSITTIVAITEKILIKSQDGYFVEDAHIIPARISEYDYNLLSEEVLKALKLLNFDNTPSHTEVKINDKGAYIIEIACRLGGDYITSDLVHLSYGVDMLGNLLKLSLNRKIDVVKKFDKVSCVQFFNQKNYENCVEYINTNPSYLVRYEIKEFHNNEIKNSFDRMGYMILRTQSLSEMENVLMKLNKINS